MSQTREQPAQQAHHAKGPWMVTAGGLDDGRSECVPISLDLGVSESRAEHRKIDVQPSFRRLPYPGRHGHPPR